MLILRILKEDIAGNDENIKQVTKIIEHPTILLYLYPNYKQRSSAVIKCFSSAAAANEMKGGVGTSNNITPVFNELLGIEKSNFIYRRHQVKNFYNIWIQKRWKEKENKSY